MQSLKIALPRKTGTYSYNMRSFSSLARSQRWICKANQATVNLAGLRTFNRTLSVLPKSSLPRMSDTSMPQLPQSKANGISQPKLNSHSTRPKNTTIKLMNRQPTSRPLYSIPNTIGTLWKLNGIIRKVGLYKVRKR